MFLFNNILINFILFCLGLLGIILNRQNILIILMSIELVLLSINLNFVYFSVFLDDIMGQIFSLIILTVASAESAIGLALMVLFFNIHGNISIYKIHILSL
ncbi:NADH-ubiquinone oxidoreductase chain 4L (mitochondrion) [Saprolegnia parasitica CBS 223.65]|jgi:NADH-quinone oxidoreductase subunit K|uniref:NADH-ubiquinone oxidoreductase chain 4L n=3 Tax=Eukaryota TaxID=2759 RepID=A0A067BC87_SAPPC|nr:NADH dehydrogenase subunit 4L [Saprolegnia ferax]XP_012213603.1 NADH-ubiquinone oxidoreductase chain 4L [Saprolegnia parasitica CBS 223.65]AAT40640.1 NADH dehydrogenase subunit 4L [Saprolegnia ferax]KDO15673.1 NADH-ubiquinone oxidoreductase chain 4L [Saprolegnia parasitica CBS 223.65]|eukprot:XP_012213603.1 NADH-ubiquinone oxidoreductase chain 4L (mitochondrion) [Saprolegnia parasitica CBS 223.65]